PHTADEARLGMTSPISMRHQLIRQVISTANPVKMTLCHPNEHTARQAISHRNAMTMPLAIHATATTQVISTANPMVMARFIGVELARMTCVNHANASKTVIGSSNPTAGMPLSIHPQAALVSTANPMIPIQIVHVMRCSIRALYHATG